jgi:hypothetical protein
MPAFRPHLATGDDRPVTESVVRELCASVTHPSNFFVAEPLRLAWEHKPEEVYWELFQGRALDGSQTRQRWRFEAWNVRAVGTDGELSAEPILSVKYDAGAGQIHVTRAVLCHAHEGYDAGDNVIQSREVVRWQRELVGTLTLAEFADAGCLRDELACRLFQAVVGASRLPLTSIEAPLPAFTLGQLGYFHRPDAVEAAGGAMRDVGELGRVPVLTALSPAEHVKLWELIIRASPPAELPAVADIVTKVFTRREQPAIALEPFKPFPDEQKQYAYEVQTRFREMFNSVSLSPYTDFVGKALAVLRLWAGTTVAPRLLARAEVLAHLTRLIARHLVAYDLVTFHHRGANYPDALFIGELLGELLALTEQAPELLRGSSSLRRAVRDALLLVTEYAGHPVPDVPTSPGENRRVLPQPFARVPDEQIESPITRRRRLFADGIPPVNELARECFRDLDDPAELRELGAAIYLDRPLGFGKAPGEPDQTLLTSHVLFSRSIADERLRRVGQRPELLADSGAVERWREKLRALDVDGLPLARAGAPPRPGVVSLHDAFRLADDWIILRSTRRTLHDFAGQYDLRPLVQRLGEMTPPLSDWRLLVAGGSEDQPTLYAYDRHLRMRLELAADLSRGYGSRGGVEYPTAGLQVLRAWGWGGAEFAAPLDLRGKQLILPPLR